MGRNKTSVWLRIETWLSVLLIVAGNCAPIVGLFWYSWTLFDVVMLFYLETVVVAFVAGVKIAISEARASPDVGRSVRYERQTRIGPLKFGTSELSASAIMGIYAFWWLFFLFVTGTLIVFLLFPDERSIIARLAGIPGGLLLALGMLVVPQAHNFFVDFIWGPAWVRRDPTFHVMPPVGRFFTLYVIVIGGAITLSLSLPALFVALFIVLKTATDLISFALSGDGEWTRDPPLENDAE
jgi:hypothetical protein